MAVFFTSFPQQTLDHLLDEPENVVGFLYPDDDNDPPNTTDLDKAWHGLHYLLTGDAVGGAAPLSKAILDGTEIGPELDFGAARYLTVEEVAAVAHALAALTPDTLAQRYEPSAMQQKQIYPDIWERDGDEALEYLLDFFPELQRFYADAAARGEAVIHWIA